MATQLKSTAKIYGKLLGDVIANYDSAQVDRKALVVAELNDIFKNGTIKSPVLRKMTGLFTERPLTSFAIPDTNIPRKLLDASDSVVSNIPKGTDASVKTNFSNLSQSARKTLEEQAGKISSIFDRLKKFYAEQTAAFVNLIKIRAHETAQMGESLPVKGTLNTEAQKQKAIASDVALSARESTRLMNDVRSLAEHASKFAPNQTSVIKTALTDEEQYTLRR